MFKALQLVCMLGGLVFFAVNFASANLGQSLAKMTPAPLKAVLPKALVVTPAEPAAPSIRYVKIDGKLFEYNPRHTYTVNGIQTMYQNGEPKTIEQYRAENEAIRAALAKATAEDLSPFSAYSPAGAKAMVDGAKEAAANVDKRNKVLHGLDKE